MGTKVIPLPGGEPAFSGNQNFDEGAADGGGSNVLTEDIDRWLSPDEGSDANPGTEAQPWLTFAPFAALVQSYDAIHATARLHILPNDTGPIPDFVSMTVPPLGTLGKVVLLGEGVFENSGELGSTFIANGSSTAGHVNTNVYPYAGDPRGWIIECVLGSNLNQRRLVGRGTAVEGGAAVLYPSAVFDHPGVGDTYRLIRPAARLRFPDETQLVGSGRGSVGFTGNDPGVYIANLQVLGAPSFALTSLWLYGVEAFADASHPGCTFDLGDQVLMGAGQVIDVMPWIDPLAQSWNGCGLTQRFDTSQIVECRRLLQQFGPTCEVNGYVCGTTWLLAQRAIASFFGGALWGQFEGELVGGNSVLDVGTGAQMRAGVFDATIAVGLSCDSTPAGGVVYAHDPDSVATIGFVVLASADATLLRAYDCGVINIDSSAGSPSGSSTAGDAQNATGAGSIVWDVQPTLTAPLGAELRVDGATSTAARALQVAPSLFGDVATRKSAIVRRATSAPVVAQQPHQPFPQREVGSILVQVATGGNATLVPAPPAGYLHFLTTLVAQNTHATLNALPTIQESGRTIFNAANMNANARTVMLSASQSGVAASAAITVAVTGTGGPVNFIGSYVRVPASNLYVANVLLTAAFQTIALPTIPAGFALRQLNTGGDTLTPATPYAFLENQDSSGSLLPQFQITRSAVAHVINGLSVGNGSNGHSTNQVAVLPPLLNGDVLEVKTTTAITVPNSVVLQLVFELVPLLT